MPSFSLDGGSFDCGVRIWLWELLSSVSNNRTFVGFRALFWRRLDRHPELPSRDPVEVTLKLRQRHPSTGARDDMYLPQFPFALDNKGLFAFRAGCEIERA